MKLKNALSVQFPPLARNKAAVFLFILAFAVGAGAVLPAPTLADTPEELQQKIADQNAKIAAIEKEIAQYESQLITIGTQKKTLQSEIEQLDLSRKKIGADIRVSEGKIRETNLQIEQLGGAISDKEKRVDNGKGAIHESFRSMYQTEETTLVEHLFTASGLANAWEEIDAQAELQTSLQEKIRELLTVKESLTVDLNATQKKQAQLKSLQRQLSGQKLVLDQNRKDQAALLTETKNKESTYQTLLAQKQQAKLEFERELNDYENALQFTIDPTQIPKAGSGVLSFPIDPDFMARCKNQTNVYKNIYCITQYYGNTAFAQSGAYKGKDHNGVDFGIPSGTRIVSALSGTVTATGNTDAYKGCYSYGKWVLVRHGNGLSTLYAHLSIISVGAGDVVSTGGLLGYSGKTGYATGPHLHFTVYVSDAVKVVRYGDVKAKTNCANAMIPVAATEAYLNPMSYL